MEARNSLLKRHPQLRFVGLHLASLEWDVRQTAAWLDSFPLTMVYLAERIFHLQHQAVTEWQKVYDFFIQYQDRIIYGTDLITDDAPISLKGFGELRGLKLPREVIDKIYMENASTLLRFETK